MKIMKTMKSIGLTMLVIVGLMIGGAAVYLVFLGGTSATPVSEATQATSSEPRKPAQPGANAKEGVAIEAMPQSVNVGETMSVIALTNATSRCVIAVDPTVVAKTDKGLQPKIADDYGTVSWSWRVKSYASVGSKTLWITCTYHGRTGMVQGLFKVEQAGV